MSDADFIARPEHIWRHLRTTYGQRASQARLPRKAAIVFDSGDFRIFQRGLRSRRVPWSRWICVGRAGRAPATVARAPIGAPGTVVTIEEMAALGVRTFVTLGACGSLRENLHIGSVVIPTFAHPDEGTSRHYGAPRRPQPAPALRKALEVACQERSLPYASGGVWTTDAPYREKASRVRELAKRGICGVDMEASAVYAVARIRGLQAASLMVVSDELAGEEWNIDFRHPAFLESKRKAVRVVVDVLAGDAG